MNSKKKSVQQFKEPSLRLVKDLDESKYRVSLLVDELKRMQHIIDDFEHKLTPVDLKMTHFNKVTEATSLADSLKRDLDESKTKAIYLESIVKEYSQRINELECNYYYKLVRK